MYNIAIIQNESEMKRYSWADIRSMFSPFSSYMTASFSASTIDNLFVNIMKYDAIVVASNATSCSIIDEVLNKENNRAAMKDFLEAGKGLFVSFQQKLRKFTFLPDEYQVSTAERTTGNYSQGSLKANTSSQSEQLFHYPHRINIEAIRQHCLSNNLVKGLYWAHYSNYDKEYYRSCIESFDSTAKTNNSLLLMSNNTAKNRIVLSSIVVDWQRHQELWENIIRYVVEGIIDVSIITKKNQITFDFQALLQLSSYDKIPIAKYEINKLKKENIDYSLFNTFILDASWTGSEIQELILECKAEIDSGIKRFFYFDFDDTHGLSPILNIVSNTREYQSIINKGKEYILAQHSQETGLWSKSFWCTLDILNFFSREKIATDFFETKYLSYIIDKGHYQSSGEAKGSYDNVMGATCGMLEVFIHCVKSDPTLNAKIDQVLIWINKNYDAKVLYEQATAISTILELQFASKIKEFNSKIEKFICDFCELEFNKLNYNEIYRYYKTFFAIAQNTGCVTAVPKEKFKDLCDRFYRLVFFNQDKVTGCYDNTFSTAAIIELILLYREISKTGTGDYKHKLREEYEHNLFDSLMRAIYYLKGECDIYFTDDKYKLMDITTVVKCISAWAMFEKELKTPLDVIRTAIYVNQKTNQDLERTRVDLDTIINLNRKLNTAQQTIKEQEIDISSKDSEVKKLKTSKQKLETTIKKIKYAIFLSVSAALAIGLIVLAAIVNWTILTGLALPVISLAKTIYDMTKDVRAIEKNKKKKQDE